VAAAGLFFCPWNRLQNLVVASEGRSQNGQMKFFDEPIDERDSAMFAGSVFGVGLAILMLSSVTSSAHEDPSGDIHPRVSVVDGKFAVDFYATAASTLPTLPNDGEEEQNGQNAGWDLLRMIYNPDGTLFAPRQAEGAMPGARIGRSWSRFAGATYWFEAETGQVGYTLVAPDGMKSRVKLPWQADSSGIYRVETSMVTEEGIALTGLSADDYPSLGDKAPLKLFWFPVDADQKPAVVEIGVAEKIYFLSRSSNSAHAGGRIWVAFMRADGDDEKSVTKLAMWSWRPGDPAGRTIDLDYPAHWNTSMSLAAIGDRLCLAYHAAIDDDPGGRGKARIFTVFLKAD